MTDFWEAIGRLVCEPDLAEKFTATLPEPHTIKRVEVNSTTGLDIPAKHYAEIQAFLAPVLSQGVLSIMAAGELYWTFSFKETRDNLKVLSGIVRQETPRHFSGAFCLALGIIIIDKYVRDQIKNGQAVLQTGPRLSPIEAAEILRLGGRADFDKTSLLVCKHPWDGSNCNSTLLLWKGHLHSRAVSENYQEGKGDNGNASAAWAG